LGTRADPARDLVMGARAILFFKWRFPMESGSNNLLVFMASPFVSLLAWRLWGAKFTFGSCATIVSKFLIQFTTDVDAPSISGKRGASFCRNEKRTKRSGIWEN
jgi:hypothetical protein